MCAMPWPADIVSRVLGRLPSIKKNLTAERRKKEDFDATHMVVCRFFSSADTVALREQIFSNSSSSVRGAWQIASCCVPTRETCVCIGVYEDRFIFQVLLTRAEGTYLAWLAGTRREDLPRNLLLGIFLWRLPFAAARRCRVAVTPNTTTHARHGRRVNL